MKWALSLRQKLKRVWRTWTFGPTQARPLPELEVLTRLRQRVLESRCNLPLWAQPGGIQEDGLFFERQLATLRQAMG